MKLPAFQFYPGDWRKDENLSRCSLAAKGALVEIMCIAFQCEEKGKLMTAGEPWSMEDICLAIGGDMAITKAAVKELLQKNVLKKDENGCIFSARMVRDENFRKVRAEGGKLGASHGFKGKEFGNLGGRPAEYPPSEPPSNPPLEPPPSSSSSSSSSKEEKNIEYPLSFPVAKWDEWKQYKAEQHGFKYKSKNSEQKAISQLARMAGGDPNDIAEIIDRSMAHGWSGLFELPQKKSETDRKNAALPY